MTLTQSERGDLEALITVIAVSISRQEFPTPPGDDYFMKKRVYICGFLCGYLYLLRGGEQVSVGEKREIERIVYERTSDLRRAAEKASAAASKDAA